jgi:hypothetical protein
MGLPDMLSENVSESEKVEQKSGALGGGLQDIPSFLYPQSMPKVATVMFLQINTEVRYSECFQIGRVMQWEGLIPSLSPISNFRTLADHLGNTPCIQGLSVISKQKIALNNCDANLHDEKR